MGRRTSPDAALVEPGGLPEGTAMVADPVFCRSGLEDFGSSRGQIMAAAVDRCLK